MVDWKHLTEATTQHEAELIAFLASIERPGNDGDTDYRIFYEYLELALVNLGHARSIAEAAPFMQGGLFDEDGKRIPIGKAGGR